MVSKVKNNKVNFKGKTVSVGIDMHKISWRITALVEGDTILAITLASPSYEAFRKIISRFKGNHVRIAYLAGPGGFDSYDKHTEGGIKFIVTPSLLIPTERGAIKPEVSKIAKKPFKRTV